MVGALRYSYISPFCCQTSFEFVINAFVYAVLAFVQKGNHAQSPCTETVIVLLGCCHTAEVGGGFCVMQ